MATFKGEDRNGKVTELTDEWMLLLPITARERDLLLAIRLYEDLLDRLETVPANVPKAGALGAGSKDNPVKNEYHEAKANVELAKQVVIDMLTRMAR